MCSSLIKQFIIDYRSTIKEDCFYTAWNSLYGLFFSTSINKLTDYFYFSVIPRWGTYTVFSLLG